MKNELIEYHRKEAEVCRFGLFASPKTVEFSEQQQFHEQAVAWLEGLSAFQECIKEQIRTPSGSEDWTKP